MFCDVEPPLRLAQALAGPVALGGFHDWTGHATRASGRCCVVIVQCLVCGGAMGGDARFCVTCGAAGPASTRPVDGLIAHVAPTGFSGSGPEPPTVTMPDGRHHSLGIPIVVGRDPLAPAGAASVVPVSIRGDLSVSKTHALIEWDGTQIWVTDLHSSNGTEIVETGGRVRPLEPGSRALVDVSAEVAVGSASRMGFRSASVVAASVESQFRSGPVPLPLFVPSEGDSAPIVSAGTLAPASPLPIGPTGDEISQTRTNSGTTRRRLGAGLLVGWATIALLRMIVSEPFRGPGSLVVWKFGFFPSGYVDLILVDYFGRGGEIFPLLVLVSALFLLASPDISMRLWLCVGAATASTVVLLVFAWRNGVSTGTLLPLVMPVGGLAVLLTSTSDQSDPLQPVSPATAAGHTGGAVVLGQALPLPLGTRIGAYLIDAVLVVVTLGIGWLIWSIMLWKNGQSPGKKMVGAVVVDRSTGRVADAGTMAVRELVGKGLLGFLTLGITGVISVFMVLFGREHRSVHDNVAGTVVVSALHPTSNMVPPPPPPPR